MQLFEEKNTRKSVVLGVDVGTTNIRCIAYDQAANVLGKAQEKLDTYSPNDETFEIIPDVLWNSFKRVVNNCLIASHLQANEVSCMGISTQRGTFLTWERETGEPFHNFISWKDKRADSICEKYNSSFIFKFLKFLCFLLYTITRIIRFQVYSSLKFQSAMVLMRLHWILEHFPNIRQRSTKEEVLFGTIDTWLIWKLTGGNVHATDGSNASVTGFFDPFTMTWNDMMLKYFKIPKQILPVVKNTCDSFGEALPHIFGSPIPICCLVGDQQASMFGVCCFQEYEVNCTMGTGSFLSINTGDTPSLSYYGIIPLIGWTIHSKTTYVAECGFHEAGSFITWMQNLGLFTSPSDSSTLAETAGDNGGLYFLPACNLKQYFETHLTTSKLVGIRSNILKENLVRCILETLAFQVCSVFHDICKVFDKENKISVLKTCGGISSNDFVVQTISTLIKKPVFRLKHNEASSLGAAFLAGLHYGIWKSLEELKNLHVEYDEFSSENEFENKSLKMFKKWKIYLKKHL